MPSFAPSAVLLYCSLDTLCNRMSRAKQHTYRYCTWYPSHTAHTPCPQSQHTSLDFSQLVRSAPNPPELEAQLGKTCSAPEGTGASLASSDLPVPSIPILPRTSITQYRPPTHSPTHILNPTVSTSRSFRSRPSRVYEDAMWSSAPQHSLLIRRYCRCMRVNSERGLGLDSTAWVWWDVDATRMYRVDGRSWHGGRMRHGQPIVRPRGIVPTTVRTSLVKTWTLARRGEWGG